MSPLESVAVVLAAGKGKRMKSTLPKPFLRVAGRRMLSYVLETAKSAGCGRLVVVVRNISDAILEEFRAFHPEWVEQDESLGTGDALKRTWEKLKDYEGPLVVLVGDAVLLESGTIRGALRTWAERDSPAAVVITARMGNPSGYGRVVHNEGKVARIIEEGDASEGEKMVNEVNSGSYIFAAPEIFSALEELRPDNVQHEYYLTDAIKILKDRGKRVVAFRSSRPEEALGINTPAELAEAERLLEIRDLGKRKGET